jgi:hypothetical protein
LNGATRSDKRDQATIVKNETNTLSWIDPEKGASVTSPHELAREPDTPATHRPGARQSQGSCPLAQMSSFHI